MEFKVGDIVYSVRDYSEYGFPLGVARVVSSVEPYLKCVRTGGRTTGVCQTVLKLIVPANSLVAMGSGGAGALIPAGSVVVNGGSSYMVTTTKPRLGPDDYGYYGEGILPQLAPLPLPKACDCGGHKTFGIISKETCVHWCSTHKA